MEEIKLYNYQKEDSDQLENWKTQFKHTPELEDIYKYILCDMSAKHFPRFLDDLHDKIGIGNNELNLVIVAKNQEEEIVGVLVTNMFDIQKPRPVLYIQNIIVNPKYQHGGNGQNILKEMLLNISQFYPLKPYRVFANVDPTNERSARCFCSMGFDLKKDYSNLYYQPTRNYDDLIEFINSKYAPKTNE